MIRQPAGRTRAGRDLLTVLALAALAACGNARPDAVPEPYGPAVAGLRAFIEAEMAAKGIPSLSIALVDDHRIVWSAGFGEARPDEGVAATANTVYRVGSVSKLFTDIAVMQQVERGLVDLDAPVTTYLPDFAPHGSHGTAITLRQLMSHRSGLIREPPVGNYFEDTEPSLAATVASLNGIPLVYPPGSRAKYSNAGIAVVGLALETLTGQPFTDYLEAAVLWPAGLARSSFAPRADLVRDLAAAVMWTYDHQEFAAPTFELGMAPAGSMYSTVDDLGRFLSILFADGRVPDGGAMLAPATLAAMWTPQYADADATTGFGLGFYIGELDGRRRIGHGGAIYGFATELALLPDEKLGVVVATTVDGANVVAERIADHALRLALAARAGAPLPEPVRTTPLPEGLAGALAGRWTTRDGRGTELVARYDRLYATPLRGGFRSELRARGDTLWADDRLAFGSRFVILDDGALLAGADTLRRTRVDRPPPAPDRFDGLIGEYGPDHNRLYVLERDGRLHALIEWFFLYPLEEVSRDVFRFPDWGLYDGEALVFTRDGGGRATRVEAASVTFDRREVGTVAGETFRITPLRPVEELREEALAASPPAEPGPFLETDLVDLMTLDPTMRFDIRYATTNNFMSAVFYPEPRSFLQRPAAEAVLRAHRRLAAYGFGLWIYDSYRPWYVTKMFFEATPEDMKHFVADPSRGSRHNRGAAVDLTLYDLTTGRPVEMVSGYDEFSDRAYPDYPGETSRARWHRELLRDVMESEGFVVYEWEWWHFDYGDWRRYPILNLTFDRIE